MAYKIFLGYHNNKVVLSKCIGIHFSNQKKSYELTRGTMYEVANLSEIPTLMVRANN